MVFVDTDVLSIFAKIQYLELLFDVFNQNSLNIAGAVENEIRAGISKEFYFARDIVDLQRQGRIYIHHPTPVDHVFMGSLPQTLGAGERESMAICRRLTAIFVSNERRVKHHCQENGIDCVNLVETLRTTWELKILTQDDVRELIKKIKIKDNLKFGTIDPIFK